MKTRHSGDKLPIAEESSNNAALLNFIDGLQKEPVIQKLEHDGITVPFYFDETKGVVPLGHLVDSEREHPRARIGTAKHETMDSLCRHVNRFKAEQSTLWGESEPRPKLTAVFDYHAHGDGKPGFGRHRAVYEFPLSEEWEAWTSKDGTKISQREFAEFIEDRLGDVQSVAPQSLLEVIETHKMAVADQTTLFQLSRSMKVFQRMRAEEAFNVSTGESQLTFSAEHQNESGGKLDVPNAFVLSLPVFRDASPIPLLARLRYRIGDEGKVFWHFKLLNLKRAFELAFQAACLSAATTTGVELFFGQPEGSKDR